MAGRLRLAATGIQDRWLTGEPQFSYFLMNFKRHTKFSIDYVENQFDGDIQFGRTVECTLPGDTGDLIKNMTLKVTLEDPQPDALPTNSSVWCPGVISHLVEYAELLIGGQVIEKITGEYISMHQQLHNTDDDVNQTLYFLNGHLRQLPYTHTYTYFMDIPFYFYRNPTLAIPICALTKQRVSVRIKIRRLQELVFGGETIFNKHFNPEGLNDGDDALGDGLEDRYERDISGVIKQFSLDTDVVYLSEDERNFLMTRPIDYVITQVQMSQFKMKIGDVEKSVMLNFKHPVKELLFISQSETDKLNNIPMDTNEIVSAELRFNNEVVFNQSGKFFTYEQPFKYYINSPLLDNKLPTQKANYVFQRFGIYSFSLYPERNYPTGQVNMSRISHKLFKIKIIPFDDGVTANDTRIYAVNYNILSIESGLAGLKF
jgi:hypothetical protein